MHKARETHRGSGKVQAETVTFGGSGLDRAAELRAGFPACLEQAGRVLYLPVWRGRPLFEDAGLATLCYLLPGDPLLRGADAPALIGRDETGTLILAQPVADWDAAIAARAAQAGNFDREIYTHDGLPPGTVFADLRMAMALLSPRDAEVAATARGLFAWHETHGFCANCGAPSRIDMGGWQRSCDSCGQMHFPRTDPVVIMLVTHGNALLIGRSPGFPRGVYSLLAGYMEPGETIEAAVRREVFEETAIRVGPVRYLTSQPWPFPSSLMIGCAGEALDTEITIDPAELEDAIWVSREDMVQVQAGQHPVLRSVRKGSIAHFLIRTWLADRVPSDPGPGI